MNAFQIQELKDISNDLTSAYDTLTDFVKQAGKGEVADLLAEAAERVIDAINLIDEVAF